MEYLGYILSACVFLLAACTQELETSLLPNPNEGEGIRIALKAEDMSSIETRANGDTEAEADSRLEHVAIYAFDANGDCVAYYEQDLEYPDNEVRMILPQDQGDLTLHAVCNYTKLGDIATLDALKEAIIEITEPDGAFSGSMVMQGSTTLTEADTQDKTKVTTIRVERLAAKIDFTVLFKPENAGDKFILSKITAHSIPKRSYLIERTSGDVDKVEEVMEDPKEEGNLIYDGEGGNESEDTSACEDAAWPKNGNPYYFDNLLLSATEVNQNGLIATAGFYMFENRRGAEKDEDGEWFGNQSDKNNWQFQKGKIGETKFPNATYVLIEGIYTTSGGTTMVVSYKVYLGKNNYADFNVFRNCHHTYTVTIRTCNDYDTRVDYDVLTNANITPAFNNPLDAHCNAVRCFGFTANRDGWILYVEEPDKHPWLEISFSPQYRPHIAGKTYYDADGQPLDEQMIAATRFEGTGSPLTKYFYIHTDEYIPANGNADESWNNTTDENAWRTGYVVLYDKGNKSSYRLEVKQRPAQIVKMPIKNLLGQTTGYNEYYVEYELEQKNLTWGFLKYGANPVMTGMINDRWDGLSNTRKLYQEAIKAGDVTEAVEDADGKIYRGAYNGYYTIEDDYPWKKDDVAAVINQIPDDHMIKYVLSKNRDRNGNGYIDYDEIVWYVPALDELAELRRVLDAGHMAFQNSEDRFHSSTPYLAGYTDEVPGRAFYVKMGDGETAFAMRDRQYNVICCRRKGAWLGNPDAGYEGDVTVDDTWDEEGEENIIMPKGN